MNGKRTKPGFAVAVIVAAAAILLTAWAMVDAVEEDSNDLFTAVLADHVHDGHVDYAALCED
jgi:hypothetical protein